MTPKDSDTALLKKIRKHIEEGTYFLAQHAISRGIERSITLPDVLHILEGGSRETDKDIFDTKRQSWKYAIRGKTVSRIEARVIVAFEENLIIITVMKVG